MPKNVLLKETFASKMFSEIGLYSVTTKMAFLRLQIMKNVHKLGEKIKEV